MDEFQKGVGINVILPHKSSQCRAVIVEMALLNAPRFGCVYAMQILNKRAHTDIDKREKISAGGIERVIEIANPRVDMAEVRWHHGASTGRCVVNQTKVSKRVFISCDRSKCYTRQMANRVPNPLSIVREFLSSEASGGVLLIGAAALALVAANSPLSNSYFAVLEAKIGPMSVLHWINDGLMALFFLLVGLEIKRELVDGHLSTWADRRLPIVAAAAGMAVPALIYLAVVRGQAGLSAGWAIPAATDIAFALAIVTSLGPRVPASLKLLLITIAIVDDMGAVAIIALFYTEAIWVPALFAALAISGCLWGLGKAGVRDVRIYFVGFVLMWLAVAASGVHPTIAGVLTALLVPVRVTPAAPDAADSTLHRMEHLLQKPVAWVVVPLFGLANAGVALGGAEPFALLPLAIALGLFLGKQIGIFCSIWLLVRGGFAAKPAGASWQQIYGIALLCGIGFTMSLFIGGLAFHGDVFSDAVKVGVLAGSLLSAGAGWVILGR